MWFIEGFFFFRLWKFVCHSLYHKHPCTVFSFNLHLFYFIYFFSNNSHLSVKLIYQNILFVTFWNIPYRKLLYMRLGLLFDLYVIGSVAQIWEVSLCPKLYADFIKTSQYHKGSTPISMQHLPSRESKVGFDFWPPKVPTDGFVSIALLWIVQMFYAPFRQLDETVRVICESKVGFNFWPPQVPMDGFVSIALLWIVQVFYAPFRQLDETVRVIYTCDFRTWSRAHFCIFFAMSCIDRCITERLNAPSKSAFELHHSWLHE